MANNMQEYECWIPHYFKDGSSLTYNQVGSSASNARYGFFLEHISDSNETYKDYFKVIKSRRIDGYDISCLFGDEIKLERVKKFRDIDFVYLGMRIQVDGKYGVVVGANNHNNLDIVFDGTVTKSNVHPHWETVYYNSNNEVIKSYKN